jgi:hypothetical protein
LLHLQPNEVLCDLGVGDARSLILAAETYNVKGIGYEIRPEVVAIARDKINKAQLSDAISIVPGNMMEADLSHVNAVHLYLTRTLLGAISLKLEQELPLGARIVTHDFDLPGWEADTHQLVTLSNGKVHEVFVYVKK